MRLMEMVRMAGGHEEERWARVEWAVTGKSPLRTSAAYAETDEP